MRSVLVFVKRKAEADRLARMVARSGVSATSLHSDRSRRTARRRSTPSGAASARCWSPQTSPDAGSTSAVSRTSSTSTCRGARTTTSTGRPYRAGRSDRPRDHLHRPDEKPSSARSRAGWAWRCRMPRCPMRSYGKAPHRNRCSPAGQQTPTGALRHAGPSGSARRAPPSAPGTPAAT